ncbi:MAG: RDD family protein [Silanimonas sp.]
MTEAPPLDTLRQVETPEGVALVLRAAGAVPRALAWLIDLGVRGTVYISGATVLGLAGETGAGAMLLLLFVLTWGYPILFEALWHGQTPGKRALGLRVLRGDGAPVGWLASITRNFLRTVDMLPIMYGAGLVSMLADPHSRRLGDLVADTVVVYVDPPRRPSLLPPGEVQRWPVTLGVEEQQALVAFGERSQALSVERQNELCDHLAPVTGLRGDAARLRVLAAARWLAGRSASDA